MKQSIKQFLDIQNDFFEIDKEKKIATITLQYENPGEIFETNVLTKTPMLNDDFNEWLLSAFDMVQDNCKLDLCILFDNMDGYSQEQLTDIFRKNIMLKGRMFRQKESRHNRLALLLVATSLIFILLMTFLDTVWKEEGTVRTILFYLLDILATVPFWGALDIFVIERKENRNTLLNLLKRFHSITLRQK